MIIALVVSVPLSVTVGYSFGPLVLIPIIAAGTLAVSFIGQPTEWLAARWSEMSPVSLFAFDVVVPLIGLSILHGFLFGLGAMVKLGSDLGV